MSEQKLPAWLEKQSEYQDGILVEALAALIHKEWVEWSRNVDETEPLLTLSRVRRWRSLWVPYAELPEEQKDKDRAWARKALQIFYGNYEEILH